MKFEKGEAYSPGQEQIAEVQNTPGSAQVGNEYNNEQTPNSWTSDAQTCLQSLAWRHSQLPDDTFHRQPPMAYHSDNFGLNTTMAEIPASSELSAYADTIADMKPHMDTSKPSYTDPVTGASVYSFYQTSSDGVSHFSGASPPDDQVLSFADETDQDVDSARESTMPLTEADMDPEDMSMCEDTRHDDGSSPPYAKLIWKAFMSSPTRSMHLQQIYEWFRQNTDKTNGESKGWMNSIRHNLSMNKVNICHRLLARIERWALTYGLGDL